MRGRSGKEEPQPSAFMVKGQLFFGHGRYCRVPVSPAASMSFAARLGIGVGAKELHEAYATLDNQGRLQGVTPIGAVLWRMPQFVADTGGSGPWLWSSLARRSRGGSRTSAGEMQGTPRVGVGRRGREEKEHNKARRAEERHGAYNVGHTAEDLLSHKTASALVDDWI